MLPGWTARAIEAGQGSATVRTETTAARAGPPQSNPGQPARRSVEEEETQRRLGANFDLPFSIFFLVSQIYGFPLPYIRFIR